MASSSTSASAAAALGAPPVEKLTRENYVLWRAQLLPHIRGAQLYGYLDGTMPAPAKTIVVRAADKSDINIAETRVRCLDRHRPAGARLPAQFSLQGGPDAGLFHHQLASTMDCPR